LRRTHRIHLTPCEPKARSARGSIAYGDHVHRLACVLVVAACSSSHQPRTESLDAGADAGAEGFAACHELTAAALPVPIHMTGRLDGADLQAPQHCATVDAPYGVETAGPDAVVHVDGLVVGQPYIVRVRSAADLSFYVITGCSTPTGPSDGDCLLFEDAQPEVEVGRFTAPQSDVYVVVDFFAPHDPTDSTFTLDVYPATCSDNADCSGATPACVDGACVECVTSFDCLSAAAPVCDDSHNCVVGIDGCTADDPHEPANDGPAGATPIDVGYGGTGSLVGQICSSPATEVDFAKFDVTSVGETWTLSLAWTGSRDLDLAVFDANGAALGLSYHEQPETITLTYLPIGTYYVEVNDASSPNVFPVAYTLTAQRTDGAGCTTAADCAAEHRNQIFRGDCSAGACVSIDGEGIVPQGGACDSSSDCATGLACPSFYFVADADTRDRCEPTCGSDGDCAPLGGDFVCTTYLYTNFCVEKCTSDDQCPTSLSMQPTAGPWFRLSCDVPSGRCL
jgi:hypothetical protein